MDTDERVEMGASPATAGSGYSRVYRTSQQRRCFYIFFTISDTVVPAAV